MIRRPPRSTRTDTLSPYTTLFRSIATPEANGFGFPAPHWLFATLRSATEALRPVAGFPQAVPASVSDISPIAQQRRSPRTRIPEARHAYRRCCRPNPVTTLRCKIGRATWREIVCRLVEYSWVAE